MESASETVTPIAHLPLTLTTFFGREEEIQQAGLILTSARLLTLTGSGGCGKTRIAIEIGRRQTAYFDTVVFVALADIAHEADILPTVADTLMAALRQSKGARETQSHSSQDALIQDALIQDALIQDALMRIEALLATRRALLILDNFEHLTLGAQIVPDLLAKCPQLACLITSRSPLHLVGERLLTVAPFASPDSELPPSELQAHPSIRLFLDRVQAVRSDFRITSQNARALAGLCADLDGLPLAMELAAARIGTFTLSEMRRQLSNGKERFQLLVARHRDTHHRHHSLTSALGWSYCQLSRTQQRFFACLSLLHGDWTAEAAHAVGGFDDKQHSLDALEQLCLASLALSATSEGEGEEPAQTTFHLLETLRQFGQQQLTPLESNEVAHRHAEFYLHLAESHASGSSQETERIWLALMERSAPNLRTALEWCFGAGGDNGIGLRLCVALTRFWYYHGHSTEALRFFTLALALEPEHQDSTLRADALHSSALPCCCKSECR